jgi:hypothetical protein
MNGTKYVGMDVHTATIFVAVQDADGKLIMESVIEAKRNTIDAGELLEESLREAPTNSECS